MGEAVFSCLLFDLEPNYGGGNEDNGDLLQKVLGTHCYTQCPQPCSRPPHTPVPETPEHSWPCLGWFLVGSLLLSPGSWCAQGFVCALQGSVSPVLCKFWWLYGGVNGGLLQGWLMQYPGLLHPEHLPLWQATAYLYRCRRHLNTQRQVWLSPCGVSGFWSANSHQILNYSTYVSYKYHTFPAVLQPILTLLPVMFLNI